MGQHYYEILDTSGSGNEASFYGTLDPAFYTQDIFNNLCVINLKRIKRKYELPGSFSLATPSRDAHLRHPGFITIYEDALVAGLRLPLHPLAWGLLIFFSITPG